MTLDCKIRFQWEGGWHEAKITTIYHNEESYGADADNNRGIQKLIIDDVQIHGILDDQCRLITNPSELLKECIGQMAEEHILFGKFA